MGSHTYNEVYGTTLNPYDLTKSAGGSSGGAGAALAAGLLPLASGSDLGGSLRNPANFNNIVALRPTVGLVPGGAGSAAVFRIHGEGADGAVGRRRCLSAERDGRGRSARSAHVIPAILRYSPSHWSGASRVRASRGVSTSADCHWIAGSRAVLEAQRKTFDRPRLRRRGCLSGSQRRRRNFSHSSRLELLAHARSIAGKTSR